MGEARLQAGIPLLLVLLLLGMSQSSFTTSLLPNDQNTTVKHAGSDPGVNDVPTWRVGDKWVYSGTFDPSILITDTGVSANVGEINGDSTAAVSYTHLTLPTKA
mgnify:FL=1